jgi:hypothetical protein
MFPVEPSRRSPRKTAVMALLLGLVIGLPLGEGLARLAFEPLDYLLPERVPDDLLGFRVAPYSGRHDAWGFRNRRVPERVDIVTIGDSQTYGWASRWRGAWPTRLEERGGASGLQHGHGRVWSWSVPCADGPLRPAARPDVGRARTVSGERPHRCLAVGLL